MKKNREITNEEKVVISIVKEYLDNNESSDQFLNELEMYIKAQGKENLISLSVKKLKKYNEEYGNGEDIGKKELWKIAQDIHKLTSFFGNLSEQEYEIFTMHNYVDIDLEERRETYQGLLEVTYKDDSVSYEYAYYCYPFENESQLILKKTFN